MVVQHIDAHLIEKLDNAVQRSRSSTRILGILLPSALFLAFGFGRIQFDEGPLGAHALPQLIERARL